MTRSRVSVVITTYNTGRYLPETLASVFAQSHPAAEVIVVDDGSSDDSVARAREFGERIRSIVRPHEGLGPARNVGIAASSGDYLAFLDSDDLWAPETLEVQLAVATRNPASGLIVADGVTFGDAEGPERALYDGVAGALFAGAAEQEVTGRFHDELLHQNLISCPAQTLLPRWAHDAVGPVCTTPNGPQDYEYYLRIARSFPITFHRARLARWRFRDDSMSGPAVDRKLRWACWSVAVLARERDASTPEDRVRVEAAFEAQVERAARLAIVAVSEGQRPERDVLDELYRAAPRNRYVLAARAICALPPAAGRGVVRGLQRSARAVAQWRGRAS